MTRYLMLVVVQTTSRYHGEFEAQTPVPVETAGMVGTVLSSHSRSGYHVPIPILILILILHAVAIAITLCLSRVHLQDPRPRPESERIGIQENRVMEYGMRQTRQINDVQIPHSTLRITHYGLRTFSW